MTNRRGLYQMGNRAAAECRDDLGLDDSNPISPYEIADQLCVRVWIKDLDLEGTYVPEPRPRIIVSSLRPMPRRTFTVAHELGHHAFGHGMTIDAQENAYHDGRPEEEDLADAFAGHLLMPAFGIRQAFHARGIDRTAPSPKDILVVASDYGVGYTTLIQHLRWGLEEIGQAHADKLRKTTPKAIRDGLVGHNTLTSLTWLDPKALTRSVELEVGAGLLVQGPHTHTGDALTFDCVVAGGRLYRASMRGESLIERADRAIMARVWPKKYSGSARWRALAETDDE